MYTGNLSHMLFLIRCT